MRTFFGEIRILSSILAVTALLLASCNVVNDSSGGPFPDIPGLPALNSNRIALYDDSGCWAESVQASEAMFIWMGYSVTRIGADDIRSSTLQEFAGLCIPGGDMSLYAVDLQTAGISKIRNFVRMGGAYIGICGGAYFAAAEVVWRDQVIPMNTLSFFEGKSQGPMDEIAAYPDYGLCRLDVSDTLHPITQPLPRSLTVLYYWGPAFLPDQESGSQVLARYSVNGRAAVLAFECVGGRVFLIGTHPEIEEDSDRDNVGWGEILFDPESEWDMMKRAVRWCLRQDPDS